MKLPELDRRPLMVAIAGPNGAGKTTFYHAHIKHAGLRFVEADALARELGLDAYAAAKMADSLRRSLVKSRESFAFETVFSDPAGDKLGFMEETARSGYTVVLCFIGVGGASVSEERVAMRVSQGGHDVPSEKVKARYPRVLANLKAAIPRLPFVYVFDQDDLERPYHLAAMFKGGRLLEASDPMPVWLKPLIP